MKTPIAGKTAVRDLIGPGFARSCLSAVERRDVDCRVEVWDDLLEFIEERRVIPVIGAQLLREGDGAAALPLHAGLARRLAKRLGVEAGEVPAEGALNHVSYLYLKGGGQREDIYPALRRS